MRIADEMFQQKPDWITFFREVLGVDGLVRKLFSTPEELAAFEKSSAYAEIHAMIAKLRESTREDYEEPTRVITVRLPKSLHESLRAEAHDRRISLNQLCISKLLHLIEHQAGADNGSDDRGSFRLKPR
jgi:predicted HicB family RNase H-like nuclease